jgi:DNA-binding transcriptional LysR family regulator
MELRQLKHYVALAETLHYGRAAERLGITQPSLSESVRKLEQSLAASLFTRKARRISLTSAGQVLLKEAREILVRSELAERMVQRAANEPRELQIGFIPTALYRTLPDAVAHFCQSWPGIRIRMIELSSVDQLSRLRAGTLDFGFIAIGDESIEGICTQTIDRSPLRAVVPSHSPLAKRRTLALSDLAHESFILGALEANPAVGEMTSRAFREAGFEPRIVLQASHTFTALKLVASGVGIHLSPALAESIKVDGVTFVPLSRLTTNLQFKLALAWVDRPLSGPEDAFKRLVDEASRSQTG